MYDNASIHGASYSFNDVTFGTKRSNSLLSNKKIKKEKISVFLFLVNTSFDLLLSQQEWTKKRMKS